MTEQSYTPKFQTIVDFVTEKIKSGEWLEGERIPSQAKFRDEYGYNYGTLRSALLILKARGYIVGRQGDGLFVCKSDISHEKPPKGKKLPIGEKN